MQTDKWTIEGAVKSSFRVLRLESILQRNACVKGEGCDSILLECARNGETRWYRRYSFYDLSLICSRTGLLFYLLCLPFKGEGDRRSIIKCLPFKGRGTVEDGGGS